MIEFALILGEEPPLQFRSLDDSAVDLFERRPDLRSVVRAVSSIYRGRLVNACMAVIVALDLESTLRTVAGTGEIKVRPMRYVTRGSDSFLDPTTGRTTTLLEQELVEIGIGH